MCAVENEGDENASLYLERIDEPHPRCALHRRIVDALAQLPEASPERLIALANLRAIRGVLARPNLSPRGGGDVRLSSISVGATPHAAARRIFDRQRGNHRHAAPGSGSAAASLRNIDFATPIGWLRLCRLRVAPSRRACARCR
jgi:hypothetical protein